MLKINVENEDYLLQFEVSLQETKTVHVCLLAPASVAEPG